MLENLISSLAKISEALRITWSFYMSCSLFTFCAAKTAQSMPAASIRQVLRWSHKQSLWEASNARFQNKRSTCQFVEYTDPKLNGFFINLHSLIDLHRRFEVRSNSWKIHQSFKFAQWANELLNPESATSLAQRTAKTEAACVLFDE